MVTSEPIANAAKTNKQQPNTFEEQGILYFWIDFCWEPTKFQPVRWSKNCQGRADRILSVRTSYIFNRLVKILCYFIYFACYIVHNFINSHIILPIPHVHSYYTLYFWYFGCLRSDCECLVSINVKFAIETVFFLWHYGVFRNKSEHQKSNLQGVSRTCQ